MYSFHRYAVNHCQSLLKNEKGLFEYSASLNVTYCWPHCFYCTALIEEEETDRREGKGRRCCLGDVIECRTSHLAAMMIWTKVFERSFISGWWWNGVVWIRWSIIHSAKRPIFYSSFSSNHPGDKSVMPKNIFVCSLSATLLQLCFYRGLNIFCLLFAVSEALTHRRRIETENKAKCRHFGLGVKIKCRTRKFWCECVALCT